MTQTRYQKGYLYKTRKSWHLRYRERVRQEDGSVNVVQKSKKIASVKDFPRKGDVMPLAIEVMEKMNIGGFEPDAAVTLDQLIEHIFLPYVDQEKRPSTAKGYRQLWRRYIRPLALNVRVRDFRTFDGNRLLRAIVAQHDLSKATVQHVKTMLSAAFTYAKNEGLFDGVNPMYGVILPKAREPKETYAYSLDEITRMLDVLPQPANAVVAVAAFTGLRKGEITGLEWEDYQGSLLNVRRSIWKGHVTPPKGKSAGTVPVIPALALMIERYRAGAPQAGSGPMFRSRIGSPLDLDNLRQRVIVPALKAIGLEWHGWHAFRRGLATNLHDLGVSDLTIQQILRHSDVSVTRKAYIKRLPEQATAAMLQLDAALAQCATRVQRVN